MLFVVVAATEGTDVLMIYCGNYLYVTCVM